MGDLVRETKGLVADEAEAADPVAMWKLRVATEVLLLMGERAAAERSCALLRGRLEFVQMAPFFRRDLGLLAERVSLVSSRRK